MTHVNRVHSGDNLKVMSRLPDGCCDLIYIDPPFLTGRERTVAGKKGKQRDKKAAYADSFAGGRKGYLAFMHPRLEQCHRLLARSGTLYVHLDWRVAAYIRICLDTIFGEENFLNEIIWHYRTGGVSRQWFGRKHDTILVYAKKIGSQRFNVLREGVFRTDGLKFETDGRPYKSTTRGKLYFNAAGPALTDVWDIPFLATVSLERQGWPTQKPLALLDRIIRASTREGDCVADFFCGSGTTLVAAKRLGRRFIGCDAAREAVSIARRRLKE
ncbi:MAG: site-specific DNA-methyltransferase [Planctomycetes bacterium]|nr:site-specific DNA-methyltransferase [Planctomycetota bacterium]